VFAVTVGAPFLPEPDRDIAPPAEKLRLDAGQAVPPPAPRGPLTPDGPRRWVRTP
jgi:hypothetical protein